MDAGVRLSTPDEIVSLLRGGKDVIITTHVNPDGDAIGSELGLARALRAAGATVAVLNHNETPDPYLWLDPDREVVRFDGARDGPRVRNADLIIIVDANQPERLRSLEQDVRTSRARRIVIDHHLEPAPFADYYLIDEEATSTGELIYLLIERLGTIPIDKRIAEPLYAAIMTDTGSFRFPRTDPDIHRIIARLLEAGADPTRAFVEIYETWTPNRMRLLGEVLDSMKTAYEGKLAYVVCTRDMFRQTGTTVVETDNFTNYPMSIRGVRIGILFNELPDGVKISFRSKGMLPINALAKEFGGNGHLNAAGARLFNVRLAEVVPAVIEKAGKYIAEDHSSLDRE